MNDMNVVLATPPGKLDNGNHIVPFPSRWTWQGSTKPFSYYPYELAYTSALRKRELPDLSISLVDGNYEQLTADEYIPRLAALEPDVLITECDAVTYRVMTRVMQGVGARHNFLCGPYGALESDVAFNDGWLPYGEEYELKILSDFQCFWSRSYDPADVMAGYTDDGYIDLDWLPWPEDDDIRRIDYDECNNPAPGMVQFYAGRGCPLACAFCVAPLYYGGHGRSFKSHRTRDVRDVCDEIEYLAWKYDEFNGVYYNEETHNADPEWLAALCEEKLRRGLDRFVYDCNAVYYGFTEDLVELAARAGYRQFRIGIESLAGDVGKAIGKRVVPETLWRLLEWCKTYGIRTYGFVLIQAPSATPDADLMTFEGVADLRRHGLLDIVQHTILMPLPGTPAHTEAKANGWLVHEDYERYDAHAPVIDRPDYPARDAFTIAQLYYALRNGDVRIERR